MARESYAELSASTAAAAPERPLEVTVESCRVEAETPWRLKNRCPNHRDRGGDRVGAGADGHVHFISPLSSRAPVPSPKPLPHSKVASSGREAVICPGFSEKFSGRPRPDPPQRFARITAATCESASIASTARIGVAGLVPPDARDGPQLREQPGPGRVDGEFAAVEPLDLTVASRNDREPFGVRPDPQPMRLGECSELQDRALLLRWLSPT